MSASLPAVDPERWSAVFRALSSPLEYADEAEWIDASLEALVRLVGGFAGMTVIIGPDHTGSYQLGVEPYAFIEMLRPMVGIRAGRARFEEPALDLAMQRTMAHGLKVWDVPYGERVTGVRFRQTSAFYHEVMRRHGLENCSVGHAEHGQHQAFLGVNFEDDRFGPLGSDDVRKVVELLLCAFEVGLATQATLGARRRGLLGSLDRLDVPVAVYDADGKLLHMNPPYRQATEPAPGGAELTTVARRLAVAAVAAARCDRWTGITGELTAEVPLRGRSVTVMASPIVSGTFHRRACALVTVDDGRPHLPAADALEQAYGLTPRQAEVARMLAMGWSNRRIAEHLGISPHTARHHAQAVLEKLGLHSRKALGLHLLAHLHVPSQDA